MDPYVTSYLGRRNIPIKETLEITTTPHPFILKLNESTNYMINGTLVKFNRGIYAFFSNGKSLVGYSPTTNIEDCALLFAKAYEDYEDAAVIRDIIKEQQEVRERLSLERIRADPKIQSQIEKLIS